MITLGIVGGVASGKSTVAREFLRIVPGAVRVDADQLGHLVLTEPAVISQLTERWGDSILKAEGSIDRGAVAKIVFAPENRGELKFLESVSHPRIRSLIEAELAKLRQEGVPLAILDAALLLETGWSSVCDKLLFISVPWEIRVARGRTRGWTEEEFRRREKAQWPVEKKANYADYTIVNDGDAASLTPQCESIWKDLQPTK